MNRKIHLILFFIILLATAICLFKTFVYGDDDARPSRQSSVRSRLCGDGVCDAKEKANPRLCPQDCGGSSIDAGSDEMSNEDKQRFPLSSQVPSVGFSYSFGVHPSSTNNYAYARDLGIDFNREGMFFVWEWIDVNKDGKFKFKDVSLPPPPKQPIQSTRLMNYDREREKLAGDPHITVLSNLCPRRRKGSSTGEVFKNENEKIIYGEFVEKLVERYDGDDDLGCTQAAPDCYYPGDGQYPDQSLIHAMRNNPVKFWQVCNQVTDACSGQECLSNDAYAIKYAEVQKITYTAVKKACPDCQVLIAGDSALEMYPPVYKALNGKYIDIIDKHFFGEEDAYRGISKELNFLKESLQSSGFDLNNLRFWITEMGTYSGQPKDDRHPEKIVPYQNETQQAQGLVKFFAVAFGSGVEKSLWAWGLFEGFGPCDCCIFDYTGLIYDGNCEKQTCDANDTYDLGKGVKKLAYYSLKMLINKIGGFNHAEKIQSSAGNYIYKFTKNNKPIYIAWNDNGQDVKIHLNELGLSNAHVTMAIPHFENGLKLEQSQEKFPFYFDIHESSDEVVLNKIPVFIEE
jgi:hypothetical protein